jgi:anti-sigma factor ChrR (cupin superfamily)
MVNKHIKTKDVKWKKVKEDILIKYLVKDKRNFQIDIMKLEPNRQYPFHKHLTIEYIFILKGRMSDETGEYNEGDLMVNFKDSSHSVKSGHDGCEFLLIWSGNLLPET